MRFMRWTAVVLIAAGPCTVPAQCPDGSPRPCAPVSARKRPPIPLNDRTWIVAPFANITRATDVEWLREGSVNLLSVDLARWSDLRVVDDKRVADFLRELPATRSGGALTLSDGLALARRAGATWLVMGNYVKAGVETRVSAEVFNVRNGTRVRAVRDRRFVTDSLPSQFGRLAEGVLALPSPQGSQPGAIGTANIVAYQEYLLGIRALNSFALVESKQRLEKALQVDSGFALAHCKLAVVAMLQRRPDSAQLRHAEAALRLSAALPQRERTLIRAIRLFASGDVRAARGVYSSLARSDSFDIEALFGLGESSYREQTVEPVPGDSTRHRFVSSWNDAIRAYRRILMVDPGFHLAFERIMDVLAAPGRTGTSPRSQWSSIPIWDRDSIKTVPYLLRVGGLSIPEADRVMAVRGQLREAASTSTRRLKPETAAVNAREWVDAGIDEPAAHSWLGR